MEALPWYISRITGMTGYVLFFIIVILGMLISTRVIFKWFNARRVINVHIWLSVVAFLLILIHPLSLLWDHFINMDLTALFIPYASEFSPDEVALGIFSFYLILVVLISSAFRKYIPYKLWKYLHYLTYPLFVLEFYHGYLVGTDINNDTLWWQSYTQTTYVTLFIIFIGFTIWRVWYALSKDILLLIFIFLTMISITYYLNIKGFELSSLLYKGEAINTTTLPDEIYEQIHSKYEFFKIIKFTEEESWGLKMTNVDLWGEGYFVKAMFNSDTFELPELKEYFWRKQDPSLINDTTPPSLHITYPQNDQYFDNSVEYIEVTAEAVDTYDPDPKIEGTGKFYLKPGINTIIVTASDASGNTSSDYVIVTKQ